MSLCRSLSLSLALSLSLSLSLPLCRKHKKGTRFRNFVKWPTNESFPVIKAVYLTGACFYADLDTITTYLEQNGSPSTRNRNFWSFLKQNIGSCSKAETKKRNSACFALLVNSQRCMIPHKWNSFFFFDCKRPFLPSTERERESEWVLVRGTDVPTYRPWEIVSCELKGKEGGLLKRAVFFVFFCGKGQNSFKMRGKAENTCNWGCNPNPNPYFD